MAEKTQNQHEIITESDALAEELLSEIDNFGLSNREFNLIVALLTSNTDKEAAERSGYNLRYLREKKRQFRPLLDRLYPALRRKALTRLILASPLAADSLVEMLETLTKEQSKSDTRRKVAIEILDRTVGKPTSKVAIEKQSSQRVSIVFPDWTPQAIGREVVEDEPEALEAKNMLDMTAAMETA